MTKQVKHRPGYHRAVTSFAYDILNYRSTRTNPFLSPLQSMQALITAIIDAAVDDIVKRTEKSRDAERFLNSKWCNSLLEMADINCKGQDILNRIQTVRR